MWMNYMVVAVEVGEFAEACRAQARIVEERSQKIGAEAVDEDVLDKLVDAVTQAGAAGAAHSANGEQASSQTEAASARSPNEGSGLLPRVLDLFQRTILPRISSQRIFRAYARLLTWQGHWADALKAYLDAYRAGPAGTLEKGSQIDVRSWQEAAREVEEIVDVLRNFGPRAEAEARKAAHEGDDDGGVGSGHGPKWIPQARSIVRTFMARSKDNFSDDPHWERLVALQEELRSPGRENARGDD